MTVIQEHNLLSFQEFLFSESYASQARAGEKAWQDDSKSSSKATADEMYNNYVDSKTKMFKITKKNLSMYKENLQKIISTLATKYKFYIDGVKLSFVMPAKIITAIQDGKEITVAM